MFERKWYDIASLSKERRLNLLALACLVRDRVEMRRGLRNFEGTPEEAIEMIRNARFKIFYCFRETCGDVTEYEVGCRFSRKKIEDDCVINIRLNQLRGETLIEQFDLEEWQP